MLCNDIGVAVGYTLYIVLHQFARCMVTDK